MRWVLVAEERIGQRLIKDPGGGPQEIVCVVTGNPVVRRFCRQAKLRCESPDKLPELPELCRELGADVLINVHGLHLLPASELAALGMKLLNVHPSYLPDLAGVYSYAWAIQYGRPEHAVTVHHMVDKIDAGDIVAQTVWPIEGAETAFELFERGEHEGEQLVRDLLTSDDEALQAKLDGARVQDLSGRTYRGFKAIKQVVEIDTTATCADAAALFRSRDFRPFPAPWPLPVLQLGDETVEVIGLARDDDDARTVTFADGELDLKLA